MTLGYEGLEAIGVLSIDTFKKIIEMQSSVYTRKQDWSETASITESRRGCSVNVQSQVVTSVMDDPAAECRSAESVSPGTILHAYTPHCKLLAERKRLSAG